MRKLFLSILMVFLGLFAYVNTMQADDETPDGQAMYLAAFKAQASPASTGSGTVKLAWIDAQGVLFTNSLVSWLNYNIPPMTMPYGTGNPSNGDTFASEAMVVGTTMTATESIEETTTDINNSPGTFVLRLMLDNMDLETENIFMTPFAYFKADAQGDNGSYFAGWTFNDARVWRQDTAMDKSAEESAYFKVLPNSANVYYMNPPSEITGLNEAYAGAVGTPNNIYAVFNKYLLSNPTAASKVVQAGETKTLDIYVDVEGDMSQMKTGYADFANPSFSGADAYSTWSCPSPNDYVEISATKRQYHFVATYTAAANIPEGKHSATLTISMAGASASTLNIPVSVMARPASDKDASVKIGDAEPTSYETLSAAVSAANAVSGDITLTLLREVSSNIELTNAMTLDLNGYTLNGALTVNGSGKTVTLAYNNLGGEISGAVSVSAGTLILNGGTLASLSVSAGATVEQNGATITGAATNNGTLTTTDGTINGGLTSRGTLTLNGGTFNGTNAVEVAGGTANICKGTLNGTSYGLLVSGGTKTTIKKLAVINSEGSYAVNRTAGTLNIECGKFGKPLNGTINFTSGYFKTNSYGVSTEGKTEMLISAGVEYTEGYRYFLGDSESAVANGAGVCRIGTTSYATLEDALAYANNNPNKELVIFMTNNYTLPAGYYTLPAKATIVVPMSDTQEKEINYTAPRLVYNDINAAESDRYDHNLPTEFRRLTFASGVNMDVFGDIELTCTQFTTNEAYTSQPVGAYGRLVMEEGSHMVLQSGSELRAWGFMTGKGETDARRGSTVREMFQMGDWKGAMTSVAITGMVKDNAQLSGIVGTVIGGEDNTGDFSDKKIFPVSQYFIQNVESPIKYHPGALLTTSAAVSEGIQYSGMNMSISMAATDIAVVGVSGQHTAIFLMDIAADAENTWVRKWYDAEHDIQVYDINSGAHIGSMELDMGSLSLLGQNIPVKLNSALFDLPITSNFKIHLLSGKMDFEQNTCLLPGSEVEVDKESTVTVTMNDADKAAKAAETPNYVYHSGAIYVYDQADWDKYAYDKKFTKVVRYAPSALNGAGGQPNLRSENAIPASAKINVHGTFNTADGYVYTSNGGANIYSSNEDAGTFIFSNAASEADEREVYQIIGKGTKYNNYESKTFTVAKLKNGDNSYTETSTTGANQVYMYKDDEWHTAPSLYYFDCYTMEVDGTTYGKEAVKKAAGQDYDLGTAVQHIYIKPQEWVEIVGTAEIDFDWSEPTPDYMNDPNNPYLVGVTGNSDHTFSDAAGAGRLFILIDKGCQWWEVEKKDNLYHCIHPENDTYYYWNGSKWVEKTFTITWKNWNGNIIQTADKDGHLQNSYEVTYGTMAEFLGTNPKRAEDIDYTYNFNGWSPALGPVTSDVTYTATYEAQPRMYTIIFQNEGGTLIETQFLKHNDVPVCENTPTKIGHTLIWSPAIAAVTGDATYTATFVEDPPTEYEVTFFDYNGTTVLQQSDVAVGATPVYNGTTPSSKPATTEFTYEFDHWSPALEEVSATSAKSYTAVYREVAKTYTVIFQNENGTEIESHEYAWGETPVCSNTPTKENTAEYTYSFAWDPQIQTVQGAATYRATFPATKNKYTVSLQSNLNGVCTFTGAGTFNYGTTISNVAVTYNDTKYTFTGWSDGSKDAEHASFELTGDITLTAEFEVKSMSNLEIAADGTETLTEATEVKDLIITSNGTTSGQLIGASYLDIKGDAIFRLQKTMDAGEWYAVAVPWQVDIRTGVYAGNKRLNAGSQFYVIDFDASAYAGGSTNTLDYWKFLHQTTNTMLPGKLYMIYLTSAQSSLDFRMKKGTSLITVKTAVALTGGSGSRANWNAIANPALYTANLATGAIDVQKYNGNDSYIADNTENMIVGEPVFVQVNAAKNVTATVASGGSGMPAYRRAPQVETTDNRFVVDMTRNNQLADRIIVQTTDEKEDKYIIGQDLAKFGVSSKVAQMWMERYDTKLCKNTLALYDDRAEYPLSIFAPVAGEYILSAEQQRGDATLYLIRDGEAIANLSEDSYTLMLENGNTYEYGLRVSAKAPQVATAIDEAVVDSKEATATKVLINNQVFIIRGERVYTVDGQLVK